MFFGHMMYLQLLRLVQAPNIATFQLPQFRCHIRIISVSLFSISLRVLSYTKCQLSYAPASICSGNLSCRSPQAMCSKPATMEMFNHFKPCVHDQACKAFCLLVSVTSPDFTAVLFFFFFFKYIRYARTPRPLLYTDPAAYKCLVGKCPVQQLLNYLKQHLSAFIFSRHKCSTSYFCSSIFD